MLARSSSARRLVPLFLLCPFGSVPHSWAKAPAPARRVGIIRTRTYALTEAKAVIPHDVHISRKYRDDVPAPLIVALHSNSAPPQTILLYQGLRQLAVARGYIAVAPMGFTAQGGFGNPPRGGGRRNPAPAKFAD
jgi:hypothetical protein